MPLDMLHNELRILPTYKEVLTLLGFMVFCMIACCLESKDSNLQIRFPNAINRCDHLQRCKNQMD